MLESYGPSIEGKFSADPEVLVQPQYRYSFFGKSALFAKTYIKRSQYTKSGITPSTHTAREATINCGYDRLKTIRPPIGMIVPCERYGAMNSEIEYPQRCA